MRSEPIKIGIAKYSGISISKDAIHEKLLTRNVIDNETGKEKNEEKNVTGVYVRHGRQLAFREINIYEIASNGTKSLLLFFYWYIKMQKVSFVFIDENAYDFLTKSKLYGDEIIISNVGANVGTVFKCPRLKWKMSLAPNAIMVKFKGDNDFYYYWLKSKYGQHMLNSIVTGSAQPKFNKTNFRDLAIPVPPIHEQKQIAKILSSLDDKIELNRRINDNLTAIE